jgi:hypothetical protein
VVALAGREARQVFGEPLAEAPQAGQGTLLEALQAVIARHLAVRDHAA